MENPYESQALLDQYLLFHYGTSEEILPFEIGPHEALHFPVRTIHETVNFHWITPESRALDLGCAVGRSSFELSVLCKEVIGIDFSSAFIEAACKLAREGRLSYGRVDEGAIETSLEARLPSQARPDHVRFEVGDATNLRADLGSFDLIHAANLICRLPDPSLLTQRLPQLLNPGGQLIITSPYTWLDEFTPKPKWLGGYYQNDQPLFTEDALKSHLGEAFTLTKTVELPFLIREHSRKYQWSVAQATVWRANGST